MKVFSCLPRLLLLSLLVAPLLVCQVRAEEDELEEEEEGVVEEEGEVGEDIVEEEDAPVEEDGKKTTSADADTTILFTKPPGTSNLELPAGQVSEFLVGFTNNL